MVPLLNITDQVVKIEKGERIAQGIFTQFQKIDEEEITNQERIGGFGSSDSQNHRK
jgi:dUTP pyrophosphatase